METLKSACDQAGNTKKSHNKSKHYMRMVIFLVTTFLLAASKKDYAADVILSKTQITMYVGDATVLRIYGTSRKVQWIMFNSSVARIVYNTNTGALIQANSQGNAILSVNIGKKTLTCNISVKREDKTRKIKQVVAGSTFCLKGEEEATWNINPKYLKQIKTKNDRVYLKALKKGTCIITTRNREKVSKIKIVILPGDGGLKNKAYAGNTNNNNFNIDKKSVKMFQGEEQTLTIKFKTNAGAALSVNIKTDDKHKMPQQIAAVKYQDNKIYITGKSEGRLTITVTSGSTTKYVKVKVSGVNRGKHISGRHFVNHRGYHVKIPENTIQAFRESIQRGFKYVETDVSFTRDNVPVLLHDRLINRTARNEDGSKIKENIYIYNITYHEALQYDFGIYVGTDFAGTKIPSLKEFLILCKRTGLKPYIELKDYEKYTTNQINRLVALARKYGLEDCTTWISFNINHLKMIAKADKKARLGFLTPKVNKTVIKQVLALNTGKNEIFIDSHDWSDSAVSLCKSENIPLEVWTLDDDSVVKQLDAYITGITTNIISG